MLFKLKHTLIIIFCLVIINSCQTRKAANTFITQRQNKEQVKKDKAKEKRKRQYQKHIEKEREKNYNKQASGTKKRWDTNRENSDHWIKREFHHQTLKERIRKFFDNFKREPKPDAGLYTEKQKRRSKGNVFQRIFKKIKKKNNH